MATQNRIKKFLNWRETSKPHITLNDELYVLLAPFRLPLILTVLTMMLGTFGYIFIDNMSLLDALYQTAIRKARKIIRKTIKPEEMNNV